MSESSILLLAALALGAIVLLAVLFLAGRRGSGNEAAARLEGQLAQIAKDNAELRRSLDERLAAMGTRMGESLNQHSERTHKSLTGLMERLAVSGMSVE